MSFAIKVFAGPRFEKALMLRGRARGVRYARMITNANHVS